MRLLKKLFESNAAWAAQIKAEDPDFFETLSKQQAPDYLWIGCADSRVPANDIVGLMPGELFVHRNVANIVVHTDFNCLSVIQYAVEVLKVEHIIVCGHYGCGGVRAALQQESDLGLIGNWLRHIRDIYHRNREMLDAISSVDERVDRLCELNVVEQVANVSNTTILHSAWAAGQKVAVHGWIYSLQNGLLRDLGATGDHTRG
ncbi:MAG: carbonate dehydratase [Verrucomicrobiota bacterium]